MGIQANELRIGNYYNQNGEYKKVDVNVIEALQVSDRIWINPIPLTEEILLKCGFEIDDCFSNYIFKLSHERIFGLTYIKKENSYGVNLGQSVNGKYFRDVYLSHIKHVHELQNLYWCLCGEELNIQL